MLRFAPVNGADHRRTMNVTTPEQKFADRSRAGVRRTVWILFACALASYGMFLYSAMHHA